MWSAIKNNGYYFDRLNWASEPNGCVIIIHNIMLLKQVYEINKNIDIPNFLII